MPKLYILCGISGSGKSFWANYFMHTHNDVRYVSRDEIRFSLLKDDEDYFSHEKDVFSKFANTITQTLVDGFDCIADATHLNEVSRRKLTAYIDKFFTDYEIIYIVFRTPLKTCLMRNAEREGRAIVPSHIIRNMFNRLHEPTFVEDKRAVEIIKVGEYE